MSERYTRVFSLPVNLYCNGAPVIIAAGALLKDNINGNILAQFKIRSIATKTIKAIKIKVYPQDTVNKPLGEGIVHEYLDLNIERDMEFGQKVPVLLSNTSTRTCSVEVIEVDFSDNEVWYHDGNNWEPLPVPVEIKDQELLKQYRYHYGEKAQYIPVVNNGAWICSCGAYNLETESACHKCRNRLSELVNCDMDKLAREKNQRLAREKAEQEAQAAREEAERWAFEDAEKKRKEILRKKIKKALIIGISVIAVCIAALLFVILILPKLRQVSAYNRAIEAYENGDYDEAISIFTSIIDYDDSADYIKYCKNGKTYSEAQSLMEAGDYNKAIELFESINGFEDSISQATEAKYQYAIQYMDSGEYGKAYDIFSEIDEYKDVKEKTEDIEMEYQNAINLMNQSQWDQAAELFIALQDYKDSPIQYQECQYQIGISMLEDCKYESAISVLESLGDYSDSEGQLLEAKYQYAYSRKNLPNPQARVYLETLIANNYKDSAELYNEMFGWRVKVLYANASKTDYRTVLDSLSKYCDYYHVGFCLGSKDKTKKIIAWSYYIVFPDGSIENCPDTISPTEVDHVELFRNGFYDNPEYGESGILKIVIVDPKTREELAETYITVY